MRFETKPCSRMSSQWSFRTIAETAQLLAKDWGLELEIFTEPELAGTAIDMFLAGDDLLQLAPKAKLVSAIVALNADEHEHHHHDHAEGDGEILANDRARPRRIAVGAGEHDVL